MWQHSHSPGTAAPSAAPLTPARIFDHPRGADPGRAADACHQAHSHARHHHAPSAPPLPIMSRWRSLARPLMRDSTTARHVSRTHALRRSHSPVGGIIPRPEPPMCTCGRRHAHVHVDQPTPLHMPCPYPPGANTGSCRQPPPVAAAVCSPWQPAASPEAVQCAAHHSAACGYAALS